ncbi:MAG TPA: hypothetical protein DEP32_13870 [Pseudomonas sp.]|nr:hypothetical protein [Pseudomonas sp.]MBB50265.1 hypothetical protein [Pseudomonadales bacterium]MBB50487.1 hypothetical protein [Pseudomonadales bacterium]HCA25248.1 hypothetical protein [Pseudomonas sp.]|tara:strand:+ start:16320 stop:16508 length:189 start_codon:yes stop_codon:yes gene_type:complete
MKLLLVVCAWLAGLVGFGLLVGGVALISVPAAMIVAGLGLLGWARLADQASARLASPPNGGG